MRINYKSLLSLFIIIVLLAAMSSTVAIRLLNSTLSSWHDIFILTLIQMMLVAAATVIISRWSLRKLVSKMAEWLKELRFGELEDPSQPPAEKLFSPIAREMTTLVKQLFDAKAAAEEEAKLRRKGESFWTPQRLKEHVKNKLGEKLLLVVSNREPYMHSFHGRKVEVVVPAGGLVTALDPVLRASGGTWVAYGNGDADWTVVDDNGRIKVPPEDPQYTLKRVALTSEEEQGYYYGFANEGLWPLCHIAHTKPIFRAEDWDYYKKVNEKFADAVLAELENVEEPCLLIQDYHFALLPRLIKEKRPDARIALFWHIPWPNPEAFGICPWQKKILHGMLGADIIGFHIQFHCNNFLETVDRVLESRIDWERFSVTKELHTTFIKPFPISVAFQSSPPTEEKKIDVDVKYIGVGVERLDYTKGILERFRAIERFFEKYPQYQGQFTFVQIGEPSRTSIKRYQEFLNDADSKVDSINTRFKTKNWQPIVFLKKHHSHEEILPYYRRADLCMVTSLHDGMNLVAKEFVASRDDEGGVLILSRFAGASKELRDALIINPYNIEQMADAIQTALEMSPEEKTKRMQAMREMVKENNIYRWAGIVIEELIKIRVEKVNREIPMGS